MRSIFLVGILAVVTMLAGCAQPNINPTVYGSPQAMNQMPVQYATVLQINPVTVQGTGQTTGGGAGMVLGGLAGSALGGGREHAALAIIGAIAGSIAGTHVGQSVTNRTGEQIVYRLDNGQVRALVQGIDPGDPLVPGCRAMVVMQGYTAARLVRVN